MRGAGGTPALRDTWPSSEEEVDLTFRRPDGVDVPVTVTTRVGEGTAVLALRPSGERSGIAIISTVSHELRSPLTSVKGYTSLMLSRWERLKDEQKLTMLEQVHHDADRVTRLVTELLDISRLETGRLVLRRQMVDLPSLAASVVEISHFGFGGEAPIMIYDARSREVVVINGQGPAPKAARPSASQLPKCHATMPSPISPAAATITAKPMTAQPAALPTPRRISSSVPPLKARTRSPGGTCRKSKYNCSAGEGAGRNSAVVAGPSHSVVARPEPGGWPAGCALTACAAI